MANLVPSDFRGTLDAELHPLFDMASNWSAQIAGGPLDFELLFTAATEFARMNRSDLAALPFAPHMSSRGLLYNDGNTRMVLDFNWAKPRAEKLVDALRDLVHRRLGGVSGAAAAQLYLPFISMVLDFASSPKTIDVFTTNYDRALESIWEGDLHKSLLPGSRLLDGFRLRNAQRGMEFDRGTYRLKGKVAGVIRLFKLHGSLNWILRDGHVLLSPNTQYLKTHAVIYPVRGKPQADAPFDVLFKQLRDSLRRCDVLLIIGSSLRDQHILDDIRFGMNQRPRLHILYCDPNARELGQALGLPPDRCTPIVGTFGTPELISKTRSALETLGPPRARSA
jgi:hypothetical protein